MVLLGIFDVAFCSACIGLAWTLAWAPGSWGATAYFFVCAIACSMVRQSYEEAISGQIYRCNSSDTYRLLQHR